MDAQGLKEPVPMADDTPGSVILLHQALPERKAQTGAERAKAYRQRKRQKASIARSTNAETPSSSQMGACDFPSDDAATTELRVPSSEFVVKSPIGDLRLPQLEQLERAARPTVTLRPLATSRQRVAATLMTTAALALAGVGITMNGWFARSLGSSDIAGWLFLAVGVSADVVALVMPACAAGLWHAGHRVTALVGWAVWIMTFVFALTAGIGFASTNISDTTLARASRTTPAVAVAQAALGDAMAARDRECKGGVGKFCREREAAVAERRQAVDTAMHSVEQTADPQTDAAIRVVAWVSRGVLQPTGNDFAMLRLVLLALLPQIGGILLLVGRRA